MQHVSWKPYSYFRPKYVIFPALYQNWTSVLKSAACVPKTTFLFQTKICDFPYVISELNCCPKECSMCPGNLIPISDQNMWFSLPYMYIRPELLSSRVQCMCPGNLISISDQNMWFSLPYIRTELLSSRVQHVLWKPYSYFRFPYPIVVLNS